VLVFLLNLVIDTTFQQSIEADFGFQNTKIELDGQLLSLDETWTVFTLEFKWRQRSELVF
jgi:hypothetical protein